MTTTQRVALAAVDAAVRAGRVPESRRAHYVGNYSRDPGVTQAVLDSLWAPGADYQATVQATRHAYAAAVQVSRRGSAEQDALADPDPVQRIRAVVGEQVFAQIVAENGPPPAMLDVPGVTASGVDSAAIAGLPWRARLAATYAATRAEVREIIDACSGPEANLASADAFGTHPAVQQWESAVWAWARQPKAREQTDPTELYAALYGAP